LHTGIGHLAPIVVYILFWVMCGVALFGRPLLTFYFIIPLLPYRTLRDHLDPFPLGGNALTILVLAAFLGALLHGKRIARPALLLSLTWLVYILYLYLSMWLGTALGNAPAPLWLSDANFTVWKDYLLIPLSFVIASMVIEDRKSLRNVIIICAITLLLIDKSAVADMMSRTWTNFDELKRDGGPLEFAGSNGLAAFLAQFAMFFWGFLQFVKNKRYKLIGYGLVAITLFGTMYTFSRAAYLAIVFGAFLLGVLKDRKLLPVLALFLVTWQVVVPKAVMQRVTMTTDANGQLEASAQERVDLWTAAKETIIHNPIFGTGFATFQYGQHTDNLKDTHNWYVKVMLETGVFGAIIALGIVGQMVILPFKLFRTAHDPMLKGLGLGLFLAVSCNLLLNLFGDRWTYLEVNGMLWVLVGAAASALVLPEQEAATEKEPVDPIAAVNPYMAYR
jgi:putative inorganic carbon (HCO3(-)) transporter